MKQHQRTIAEARQKRVSELYLAGVQQYEIARMLSVEMPNPLTAQGTWSQATISVDLKKIRLEWRSSTLRNFDEAKSLELARIDHLEREAMQAWYRSIGIYKTETTKNTHITAPTTENGVKGEIELPAEEITIKKEKLAGDPRFITAALDCVKKRCEILGLNAPTTVNTPGLDAVAQILSQRLAKVENGDGAS